MAKCDKCGCEGFYPGYLQPECVNRLCWYFSEAQLARSMEGEPEDSGQGISYLEAPRPEDEICPACQLLKRFSCHCNVP